MGEGEGERGRGRGEGRGKRLLVMGGWMDEFFEGEGGARV